MKITKHRRSKILRGVWLCYAAKGGRAALREDHWYKRMRNWNGIGFNKGHYSYWIEFRRYRLQGIGKGS